MKNQSKKLFFRAVTLVIFFLLFTFAVKFMDVRPVAAGGTEIGFAALNLFVFELLGGYHPFWYDATGWIEIAVIALAGGFALLGLSQLVHRRSFLKVDLDIYVLGAVFAVTIAAYAFFELVVVNCRPVDLGAGPEASFPSSHTMTVMVVMLTASMQFRRRTHHRKLRVCAVGLCYVFAVFTLIGRLISGAHWFSDIFGGMLLAAALITAYRAGVAAVDESAEKHRIEAE